MMDAERLADYLRSLEKPLPGQLEEIAKNASARGIPIVRRETAGFLATVTALTKPHAILEIGTAVGFSALVMAQNMPEGCRITTIENDERRIPEARENFRAAGLSERITLLEGDASEVVPSLTGRYDLIFLDAAKGQYLPLFPEILRLLSPGGAWISDNVLQEGDVLESRFAVKRRDRTIHSRMREFIWLCKHHPLLTSSLLPLGDGVMLCVRQLQEERS